jgi:hypothetical protein
MWGFLLNGTSIYNSKINPQTTCFMTIPDYQTCMLPLLKFVSDQKEHSLRETVEKLATQF